MEAYAQVGMGPRVSRGSLCGGPPDHQTGASDDSFGVGLSNAPIHGLAAAEVVGVHDEDSVWHVRGQAAQPRASRRRASPACALGAASNSWTSPAIAMTDVDARPAARR